MDENVKAEEVPQRVIVQTTEIKSLNDVSKNDVIVRKTSGHDAVLSLEVPRGETISSFQNKLKKTPGVVHVEPDHLEYKTYAPNDSSFYLQSHHQNIQSEKAWERSKGDASVIVAVIDDGIDLYHKDLSTNIVDAYDVVNSSSYMITRGDHGTHVSGIIGGIMDNNFAGAGVAPNTSIMPINVFTGDGAYASDVITAIYRAVDHGASIINMSLGSYYYNSIYQSAIDYAHEQGVVVIAAAGNDTTSQRHYPSSYEHVVSVASTTSWDSTSYFSNYGDDIDISAPGSSIYSTLLSNGFGSKSGTSMASPVVAGVAALIKADDPTLTNDEIVTRLENTADDLGTIGWDMKFGHGRVNAASALLIKEYGSLNIEEVTDQMTTITGEIPYVVEDATIRVRDDEGQVIGERSRLTEGPFTIEIPKQQSGQNLSIQLEDAKGNHSPEQMILIMDRTAPAAPYVDRITDQQSRITGRGEANSSVRVFNHNNTLIQEGYVNETGNFSLWIDYQKGGGTLSVVLIDQAGNVSEKTLVSIVDWTAPELYDVSSVSDRSTSISGFTEPYTKIRVTKNGVLIGKAVTEDYTDFSIPISRQTAGVNLLLSATDRAGNTRNQMIRVLDKTAPISAKVSMFSDAMTMLSAVAEKDSTVVVMNGRKKIGQVTSNSTKFSIPVPKQKAGTKLKVYVYDQVKQKSPATDVVVMDKTAPAAPTINKVTKRSQSISGHSEPNATVYVYVGKKKIVSGRANKNGIYGFVIKPLKSGTILTVYAVDAAKHKSKSTTKKVL